MKNDGGPAFPVPNDANMNEQEGMSLRDWFAGMALQGLASAHNNDGDWTGNVPMTAAADAYAMADAMLAAREPK